MEPSTFLQHFDKINDPRIQRHRLHELLNILLLSICAVISRPAWSNGYDHPS
ncbi:transposase family protein [Shewanella sp. 202IG2-18]|uniref:transposase family protein n=1 Tax=Parashewanella hymeniacidonis TaxID=2807618 RepID=UPI0019602327|nr:transposase family protein [Parashewanella hymeniacidonis]